MGNPSTSFLAFNPSQARNIPIDYGVFMPPSNPPEIHYFCVVPYQPLSTDIYLSDVAYCKVNEWLTWTNPLTL